MSYLMESRANDFSVNQPTPKKQLLPLSPPQQSYPRYMAPDQVCELSYIWHAHEECLGYVHNLTEDL